MSIEKIQKDWKLKLYKPLYWLEGDEDFYIDELMNFAEHQILSEADAQFNLSVFYGKDANWTEVVNACRRYPMFSEKQVVLLKEAQQMRDIEKLEGYVEKSLASTIFVVSYKGKKLDGRSKLSKILKTHGELVTTKKIYDNQLPQWTGEMIKSKGYSIDPKALLLLVDHIGNDLSRIANEVEKVLVNLGNRKTISQDDIENFVGISKEYNVFELQHALGTKDLSKAITIIQYFESNPKAAPIQMILPALYGYFSKVYSIFGMNDKSEKALMPVFYNNPIAVKQALQTAMNYSFGGLEQALLLLHEYNLKSVGINSINTSDASLLKEMTVKIIST